MTHDELIKEFEIHKAIFKVLGTIHPWWQVLQSSNPQAYQFATYAFCASYSLNEWEDISFETWIKGFEERYTDFELLEMKRAFNKGREGNGYK